MAAGPFTILDVAIEKIGGAINLETDAFNVVLTTQDQVIAETFVGASLDGLYADLTNEITGTGYTAGGVAMTGLNWSRTGGVSLLVADPTVWAALTATMKYALVVKNVGGVLSDILGFVDLELTDPVGRTSGGGDFIITWASGLFDLKRAP